MRARWAVPFSLLVIVAGAALVCPGGGEAPSSESSGATPARADITPVFEEEGTPGLTVEGRVLDPRGAPLQGAEVHLAASAEPDAFAAACPVCQDGLALCAMPSSLQRLAEAWERGVTPARTLRTDAQGRFRFEGLRRASVAVWAEAEGYGAAVAERAAPGVPVELRLVALRRLHGSVFSEGGVPLPGARVLIRSRVPVTYAAESGGGGAFSVPVGDGPFEVIATAPGHAPVLAAAVSPGAAPVLLHLPKLRAVDVVVLRDGAPADAEIHVVADHLERAAHAKGGFVRVAELPGREVRVLATAGGLAASATVLLREAVTRAELHLSAGGSLAVTVIDPQGQPAPSPTVTLVSGEETLIETKGETGARLVLGPVPVGPYQLVVAAEGFDPRYVELAVGRGERSLDVVLQPLTSIRGRVLDVYGRPAPGVAVSVAPAGEDVTSAADGTFRIEVPMPGVYSVSAHHSDWGGATLSVTAPATDVEVTLEPQATVRAVVRFDGAPVEGATLTLAMGNNSFYSDRTSGASGEVVMRGLPAGEYLAYAEHPAHLPSRPLKVQLVDGATEALTLELQEGAAITGVIRDDRGAPIGGATVSILPPLIEPVETTQDGRFTLTPLRRGHKLRVMAEHPDYGVPKVVALVAGGPPGEIVLPRAAPHFGRVVSSDGTPITSFQVNGTELRSPDGRFEVPIAEDPSSEEDFRAVAVTAPGHLPRSVYPGRGVRSLGTITLDPSPQLLGRVVDTAGAPQSGVEVSCAECAHGSVTDEAGRFSLDVTELGGPGLPERVEVSARLGSAAGRAAMAPGASADIVLQRGGRLTVRVYDAQGRPAPGAAVFCETGDNGEEQTLVTGPEGAAEAEMPPGPLKLSLGEREPYQRLVMGTDRREVALGAWPGSGTLTVEPFGLLRGLELYRGDVSANALPPVGTLESVGVNHPRGKVRLVGLRPGRYTLVAYPGGIPTVHPVTIAPGEQLFELR